MAMDFRNAGERVRSLIAAKKPQQLSESALPRDVLRDNIVEETIRESRRFQALADEKPTVEWSREQEDGSTVPESFEWHNFGEALRDVARAAYQWDEPHPLPAAQVRKSALFNREIVSQVIRSEPFRDSRAYTRDNPEESIFGAQAASFEMIAQAPSVAEHLARASEMAEQEQEIDDAERMLEELRAQAREQHDELHGIDPELVQQIKDQVARRQNARGQLGELVDQHQQAGAGKAAKQVATAIAEAHQDAVQTAHLLSTFPGCEPGSPHNLKPGAQIALAEKLLANPELRKICEMAGRLVTDMRFKRQARTRNVKVEPVGVTTGNDVTQLLPHELARMQIPALKPLWALDWANRSLLEWEMGGKEPSAKGPIIVVVDGSGSMSGDRFIWASALMLALLTMAQREKRDFAGVEFGSARQVKSWLFPGREAPNPDQVIDMATHFFDGGTDNATGMREAKRIIDSVPAFKTADVIILSDGQDRYEAEDAQLVAELTKLDVRIHGISILCPGNRYLAQACEYVIDVAELVGSNNATDALAQSIT